MNFAVQWRKPAQPKGKSPLAILFHGRTSNERDIMAQAGSAIPEGVAVASLRGPIPVDEGGYTWFVNRGLGRPVGESLRASVDRIHGWIDGIDVAEFDTSRLILVGFSAGMLIASAVLLDRPDRFFGAVLLAGTFPWDNDAVSGTPAKLRGKPIFYARGDRDTVIPMDLVERSVDYLKGESDAILTMKLYPLEHEISSDERRDIASWIDSVL